MLNDVRAAVAGLVAPRTRSGAIHGFLAKISKKDVDTSDTQAQA
jgi:hypothetical protein